MKPSLIKTTYSYEEIMIPKRQAMYLTPIEEIRLSTRMANVLKTQNILRASELLDFEVNNLLSLVSVSVPDWLEVKGKQDELQLSLVERHEILTLRHLRLCDKVLYCLYRAKIRTIQDLTKKSYEDLEDIHNFGVKCQQELRHKLIMYGIKLKPNTVSYNKKIRKRKNV